MSLDGKQMANGTCSSDRAKDEENNNGMPRRNGEKGKTNSCSSVSGTTGVRRSPREKSSKKITPGSSSTQKSKQLEMRTHPSPAVKQKSERVEKQNMPTPLRRSERTRSHSSSSPSDSKSSASLSSKQRPKKEKCVKQLTFEAKEVSENEEHDLETSPVKVPRMDARRYRAMFRKPNNDCLVELNKIDKSTQEFGNNDEGKIDECSKGSHFNIEVVSKNGMLPSEDDKVKEMIADSRLSGTVKNLVENNLTMGSSLPSNATTSETSVLSQRVQPDSCRDRTLQKLESRNSVLDDDSVRNSVGHDSGENLIPSKRNGTMTDMISDVSATLANDDDYNMIPSRLGGYIVGTGGSCSKRRRLDCDHTISCPNESCNPSATELQDGGDTDASLLQKECPANSLTEVAKNLCLICKSEGQLLFCGGKGCTGSYHRSCLEPPLADAPIGVWHCHFCVRKKIEFGVYSVSDGIESVCDIKETPFSNVDGVTAQKSFLVKYKGLAHFHNQWIPENQLLLEAPSLLMDFNMKYQTPRLKPEWSLPHRLLQKRALICFTQHDDNRINHAVDDFDCCYEWLVKWRGLGYEHVTWELDNASFLHSPEGQSLIRGYEERFQRAKRVSSCSKLDKKTVQGSSVSKLCQMPGGVSSGVGNSNFLEAVNKLREHWYKGQNAIVIDDHERILKVVAFILSLHSDTSRPFLIISTAASLHSWEDEFYQLDPSIDVVIYSGNKEIRNSVRTLEFHDGGGCILFQVLIVVPEILTEDIHALGGIDWEAIFVDECQSPKVLSYFRQLKILKTHFWVLLFRGQLKDSIADYSNILALLDCQSDNEKNSLIPNSSNSIDQLKERFSSYIAYSCKSDSFRFVEFWVPVQISHVQLEQYCLTLHSNASILRSSSKMDIEALRDVLSTTRKCCSHPCIVDPSLNNVLTTGVEAAEYLDAGIKASGKLQLLDSLLMELKEKKLRGLVLFQSIGASGRVIGDILDDFLRQRFGPDSYERIDRGLLAPKKQKDAMQKFNNKDDGRFVFLLETCACRPNIKLSSVDAIIIFDSDLNPMNDIRSLQKITLDSQFELIKIFRLYSSFTVEENALILAKQDKTLDINLQNISRSTCHMLLMCGASSLFDDLRVFHDDETSMSSLKSLSGQKLLEEAVHEFSSILSQDGEDNDTSNCAILSRVQQNGVTYRAKFPLPGEQKPRLLDEEPPNIFWTKLLEGKQFRWKYAHSSSQRSRKRANHFNGLANAAGLASDGMAKKRRKVSNDIVDKPSSKYEGLELSTGIKTGTYVDRADRLQLNGFKLEKQTRLYDEQRSLHLLLKPEITKLCEVLLLPDNVKSMVDNFLEYVMNNHHVRKEPVSILQAFQISLSWTVAPLLNHKLDHKASLLLAKQHLNFDCKKEEVEYVHSMLRCLRRIFLYSTGNSNDTGSPKASESSKRDYSSTKGTREIELFKRDVSKSVKDIRKKCEKQRMKLSRMQDEEKQRLESIVEDEKAELERIYKIEFALNQSCSPNVLMRTEKLNKLKSEYSKRWEKLKHKHEKQLMVLEEKQLTEMLKYKDREDTWVEEVRSWEQLELFNMVASKEYETGVEYSQDRDQEQPRNGPKNVGLVSDHFTEGTMSNMPGCGFSSEVNANSFSNGTKNIATLNSPEKHIPSIIAMSLPNSENVAEVHEAEEHNGSNNAITENSPLSNGRIDDGAIVSVLDREVPMGMPRTVNVTDCPENVTVVNPPPSVEQIPDEDALDKVLDSQLSRLYGTAAPSNGADTITHLNPSLEQQISDGVSLSTSDGDIPVIMPENGNEVADCHDGIQPLTDTVLVDRSTMSDQQEGVPGTVMECPLSQETLVPVDVMGPPEQLQQLSSVEVPDRDAGGEMQNSSEQVELVSSPVHVVAANKSNEVSQIMEPPEQLQQLLTVEVPDQDTAGEMQNSSDQIELASSPVHVVAANKSNVVSPIMEPSEQVQQLPSLENLPSNRHPSILRSATGVEQQSISESDLAPHDAEASTVVPNQLVQPDSNKELVSHSHLVVVDSAANSILDSHSHQVVVDSAANSNLDSLRPGGVRTEPSNSRNLSTPSLINNHHVPTATHSASRMYPPLYPDPLKNELERIRQETEQLRKGHEDMKLQLKSNFEKDLEELRRKYDIKFQEVEVEFQQTKKNLDTSFRTVFSNKILADAFRSKCLDRKVSGAFGVQQDASFGQRFFQFARQQSVTRPSQVAGPSSCGPPAVNRQSPSTAAGSQRMLPPVRDTSGILSSVAARQPLLNSMASPLGNFQVCGEMRAPAPHLQPYRPSTSVPASSLPALQHGMPSQHAPNNNRATSPSLSYGSPQPKPMTHPPGSHMGHQLRVNANSQPAINLPNGVSSMSDVALKAFRFGTSSSVLANSSNQAASPDIVCLSDDD